MNDRTDFLSAALVQAIRKAVPGMGDFTAREIAKMALATARRFDRKLIHQLGATVTLVSDGLDDEGDRVYLESTNHKEVLRHAAELYDEYRIERGDGGADVGIP